MKFPTTVATDDIQSEPTLVAIAANIYASAIAGNMTALSILAAAGVHVVRVGKPEDNAWDVVKDHVTIHINPVTEQRFSHPMIAADDGSVADAKADDARKTTPQGAARETIDNLRHHPEVLGPKLIDDLHDAAKRAFSDKAITGRKW